MAIRPLPTFKNRQKLSRSVSKEQKWSNQMKHLRLAGICEYIGNLRFTAIQPAVGRKRLNAKQRDWRILALEKVTPSIQ